MFSRSAIIFCLLSAAAGVTYWSEEYEVQRSPQNHHRLQNHHQHPDNQLRTTVRPEIKFYSEAAQDDSHYDSPLVTPYPLYVQSTTPYAKEVPQKYPLQDYIAKNIPQQSNFIVLDQNYPTEAPRPFSLNVPLQRPYVTLNRERPEANQTRPGKITKAIYPKKQYKQKTSKQHSDAYPALVGTPYPVIKKLPYLLTETKSIPKYIEGKRIHYKYNEEPYRYQKQKPQPFQENIQNTNQIDEPLLDNQYKPKQTQEQYQTQTVTPYHSGKYIQYQVPQQPIYPLGKLIPYPFQNQFSYQQGIFVPKPVLRTIPYQFQNQHSYEVEENRQEDEQNIRNVQYPVVLPYKVAFLIPYNVGAGRITQGNIHNYQSHVNPTTHSTISPVLNELNNVVTPSSKQTVARYYDGHFSKYNKQQEHPVDNESVTDSDNQEDDQQQHSVSRSDSALKKQNRMRQIGRSRSDNRRLYKSKN